MVNANCIGVALLHGNTRYVLLSPLLLLPAKMYILLDGSSWQMFPTSCADVAGLHFTCVPVACHTIRMYSIIVKHSAFESIHITLPSSMNLQQPTTKPCDM